MFSTDTLEEAELLRTTFGALMYTGEMKGRLAAISVGTAETTQEAFAAMGVIGDKMLEVYKRMLAKKSKVTDTHNRVSPKIVTEGTTMDDRQKLISAIASYGEAVMLCCKATNFARGSVTAVKAEKAAAKKVLRLILGRIPTDEEVDQLIVG